MVQGKPQSLRLFCGEEGFAEARTFFSFKEKKKNASGTIANRY
jgi:hypothetical protein